LPLLQPSGILPDIVFFWGGGHERHKALANKTTAQGEFQWLRSVLTFS
jgi:hypothetical protein